MTLNHLNLTVTDVIACREFLAKYFDLKVTGGNAGMSFLQDKSGFVLSLMKAGRDAEVSYPPNFHIGFIVGSRERVDEINHRLKADGYDVPAPEQHHAWTFYFQAPGGITVEVLGGQGF